MPIQLDKNFFENILKEPIDTISSEQGSKKGDNVAGDLQTISVQTSSGKLLNLLYKGLPSDPAYRQYIVSEKIFRTENTFYSFFAPALEKWAKSRNANFKNNDESFLPKYYAGLNDDKEDYLIMEDLRAKGYRMADKFVGLNFEETSATLKSLAAFHAMTFGFIQEQEFQQNEQYEVFHFSCALKNPQRRGLLSTLVKATYGMVTDLVRAKNPELADKMQQKAPDDQDDFIATSLATGKKFFPVIVQGDFWVNNILFKHDKSSGGETVEDVKFIDFQLTRYGNIFEDLQYFFFTSTTPEFRKKYLIQVLDSYATSFLSTLDALKCKAPENFSSYWLAKTFKEECFLQGFFYLTFAVPFQLVDAAPGIDNGNSEPEAEKILSSSNPDNEINANASQPNGSDSDLPIELQMMLGGLRMSFINSPRAQARVESVAKELVEMGIL